MLEAMPDSPVSIDPPIDVRPFAQLAKGIEPERQGDFQRAFQPFQESMGFDQLQETLRGRIRASQRIDREFVLSYWKEVLTSDLIDDCIAKSSDLAVDSMSPRTERTSTPWRCMFGHRLVAVTHRVARAAVASGTR
jgi:hypothetical protein